jgi:hypothetical protein
LAISGLLWEWPGVSTNGLARQCGEHGVLAHMVRSILKALGGYEIPHAERHEQELLAGHFGIGVTAKQEEDQKKVRDILKSHNGHFINFYGMWTMEKLEP